MPTLIALTPINHDGKQFDEGDTFTVADDAQAEQLVEANAAMVKGRKSKAAAAAETMEAAALAAAQAEAQAIADAAAQAGAAPGA